MPQHTAKISCALVGEINIFGKYTDSKKNIPRSLHSPKWFWNIRNTYLVIYCLVILDSQKMKILKKLNSLRGLNFQL
jgi:hypothetical protein